MHNGLVIASQDVLAIRDLIRDCEDALQCIRMAASSLHVQDSKAIQFVQLSASMNLESIKELLGGCANA